MNRSDSLEAVYVDCMCEFSQVIMENGALLRVPLAARLCDVSRQYLLRLAQEGRFRKFFIMGELHLSERAVLEWAAARGSVMPFCVTVSHGENGSQVRQGGVV